MKKTFFLLFGLLLSGTCWTQIIIQDSIKKTPSDTILRKKNIYSGPGMGIAQVNSAGFYTNTINDQKIFQLSAGMQVVNTLRGQSPNVQISPFAQFASASIRGQHANYVIDGFAFNNTFSSHYNFNAFEYKSVSVISSGNAASYYGGAGLNSLIFLESKTGENYTKPTAEVNTYTTYAANTTPTGTLNNNDWMFVKSVAYMQDFGPVDTRISYTYSLLPSAITDAAEDGKKKYSALRVNTGFDISKRFKARLILDDYYTRLSAHQNAVFDQTTTNYFNQKGSQQTLQGNLTLQFRITDWLTLRSQSLISRIRDEFDAFEDQRPNGYRWLNRTTEKQQRSLLNLFVSANHKIYRDFGFNAFAGWQQDNNNNPKWSLDKFMGRFNNGIPDNSFPYGQYSGTSYYGDVNIRSLLAGFGLTLNHYAFISTNYRKQKDEKKETLGLSGAFIFSEALHLESNVFSSGRIRFNYAKSGTLPGLNYPRDYAAFTSLQSTYESVTGGYNYETGMDLAFAKNKITLGFTRFKNSYDDTKVLVLLPTGNASQFYYVSVGKKVVSGYELSLGIIPVQTKNISVHTKINWGKYSTSLDNAPEFVQTRFTGTEPNWQAGIYNQVTFSDVFFSFLIDVRNAQKYTSYTIPTYGYPYLRTTKGSYSKVRDLSVGYRMKPSFLTSIGVHEASVSVSARNLITLSQPQGDDFERSMNTSSYLKSVSLSVSVVF